MHRLHAGQVDLLPRHEARVALYHGAADAPAREGVAGVGGEGEEDFGGVGGGREAGLALAVEEGLEVHGPVEDAHLVRGGGGAEGVVG